MQYGIRSITMEEIAVSLGVSKKTLYQYYADKDELVEAVVMDIIQYNQACCARDQMNAKDAIHEVFLAVKMMQEMFENMNPSVLFELEKYHPKAFTHFVKHKYLYLYKVLRDNLERGIKEEFYRPEMQVEIIVKARLETMMLAFNQQVFPKTKFQLANIETELTEHYLYGIASLKGHKQIMKYKQESNKKTNTNEKIMAK